MTEEFKAGVDWLLKMQSMFSFAETKLIWTLLKADGQIVSTAELEFAVTGRRAVGSKSLNVRVSQARIRARGIGLEIVNIRRLGYRIDVLPSSSLYASLKTAAAREVTA